MPYKDKTVADAAARRRYAESPEIRSKRAESATRWHAAYPDVGRAASLAWYHRNAESVRARKREQYAESREAEIQRTQAWQAANPKRTRDIYAKWRAENPEKYRAAVRRWNQQHPEKVREYANRRRTRKLDATIAPVDELAVFNRDGWVCQLCLAPVDSSLRFPDPMSPSLDHIRPLSRGGTHEPDNVQLAHLRCNISKGNRETI